MPDPEPRRIVLWTPERGTVASDAGILAQVEVIVLDAIAKAARTGKPVKVKFRIAVTGAKP